MTADDSEPLLAALCRVIDPELGRNIVELGLVYEATLADGIARITMTLTTPGCPAGPMIVAGVRSAAGGLPDVGEVVVDVVWTPRWTPERMTPEVRRELGIAD